MSGGGKKEKEKRGGLPFFQVGGKRKEEKKRGESLWNWEEKMGGKRKWGVKGNFGRKREEWEGKKIEGKMKSGGWRRVWEEREEVGG